LDSRRFSREWFSPKRKGLKKAQQRSSYRQTAIFFGAHREEGTGVAEGLKLDVT